jgi:hypothetical protein
MALGLTQPLNRYVYQEFSWGKAGPARKADNLTAICEPIILGKVGSLTSHNRMGLHGLLYN